MASSRTPLDLTPRPDLGILIVRWADDAPSTQIRNDYTRVLSTAVEYSLGRWLLDVRRRDQLAPEIGQWTTMDFYPQAAAQLAPHALRISVLCSPARLAVYDADPTQKEYLSFGLAPERSYQMRLFIEEKAAMEWLVGYS